MVEGTCRLHRAASAGKVACDRGKVAVLPDQEVLHIMSGLTRFNKPGVTYVVTTNNNANRLGTTQVESPRAVLSTVDLWVQASFNARLLYQRFDLARKNDLVIGVGLHGALQANNIRRLNRVLDSCHLQQASILLEKFLGHSDHAPD